MNFIRLQPLRSFALAACLLASAWSAHADECDKPKDSAMTNRCLGSELFDADGELNRSYNALQGSLDPAGKQQLKKEQLRWLKERDEVCNIHFHGSDRYKWHDYLTEDYRKAICVIRYSKARTVQLEDMAARHAASTVAAAHLQSEYQIKSDVTRTEGQWYFEVLANPPEMAKTGKVVMWAGCGESKSNTAVGTFISYQPTSLKGQQLISIAIDLDHGKLYHSVNGVWSDGQPNSAAGMDVKLGRPYQCGVELSELVQPLVQREFLDANFGEKPFIYAPPEGYHPFRGNPIWVLGGTTEPGATISVDFNNIHLRPGKPTIGTVHRYDSPQSLKERSKQYTAIHTELVADCGKMQFSAMKGYFADENGLYAGTQGYAPTVDNPADDKNFYGQGLLKTVCFLSESGLHVPSIEEGGTWENMISPVPDLQILEAPSRRERSGPYLLVVQKNVSENPVTINGKPSKVIVGVSALNCREHSMRQLIRIRYGMSGEIVGSAYYDPDDAMPKIPENRKRFEDACNAVQSK